MIFIIHSQNPISDAEKAQVKDLLTHSLCINESLRNAFPQYDHREGEHIYFNHSFWDHETEIECTPREAK